MCGPATSTMSSKGSWLLFEQKSHPLRGSVCRSLEISEAKVFIFAYCVTDIKVKLKANGTALHLTRLIHRNCTVWTEVDGFLESLICFKINLIFTRVYTSEHTAFGCGQEWVDVLQIELRSALCPIAAAWATMPGALVGRWTGEWR